MTNLFKKSIYATSLTFLCNNLYGQGDGASSNFTFPLIITVVAIVAAWAFVTLTDNLMQLQAKKVGLDTRKNNFGLFPSLTRSMMGSKPDFIGENSYQMLTKGADIKLAGPAENRYLDNKVRRYAVQPNLFTVMSPIPKVTVEVGSTVKAGDVLYFDKKRPEIKYVAPVSGEIVDIIRGPKRAIHKIVILGDKDLQYKSFNPPSLDGERQSIVDFLLESGGWSLINERPFDMVPNIDSLPRDIFISTFDSAPLAPDLNFVIQGQKEAFQKGCDVLSKLTEGNVHLGLNGNHKEASSDIFKSIEGVTKHYFAGKHPAGNVGVQIHHISPIKAGQSIWTLNVQDVITIGKLFLESKFDASRIIALTGHRLTTNGYTKTHMGANVKELIGDLLQEEKTRIVGGDVLSGRQIGEDGYLSHNEDQISTLHEGDNYELFGWLLPLTPRPSFSGTFPNFLYKNHRFEANTNTHGEKRAFVVSGQYEEVLPMDIYLQHLMKAILTNDYEKMEGLGIYELSPEDVALCEFSCTSKMPLQSILKDGLDTMRAQL
jgi:Na+-transporting NADH:ubiquinone oxidoreductase subunit A